MFSSVFLPAMLAPSILCGLLNGFFGTGGGIPLVFALGKQGVKQSKFRIALSITFWLCLLTLGLSGIQREIRLSHLFLLLSSSIGGLIGCRLLFSFQNIFVNRLFAILLLVSGALLILRTVL